MAVTPGHSKKMLKSFDLVKALNIRPIDLHSIPLVPTPKIIVCRAKSPSSPRCLSGEPPKLRLPSSADDVRRGLQHHYTANYDSKPRTYTYVGVRISSPTASISVPLLRFFFTNLDRNHTCSQKFKTNLRSKCICVP